MKEVVYTPLSQQAPTLVQPQVTLISLQSLLLQYGTRVVNQGGNSDFLGETTIYTVPEGKVFFLLTASLCVTMERGLSNYNFGHMYFGPASISSGRILQIDHGPTNGTPMGDSMSATESVSPSIPLKMTVGEYILVFNAETSGRTVGQISGYEIDEKFLKNIA